DVKSRKTYLRPAPAIEIKAQKVDHFMVVKPVKQVAGDAPKNQSQGNLAPNQLNVEMAPPENKARQRQNRHRGEIIVVIAKRTPGSPGIGPTDELEEPVDDHPLLRRAEMAQHHQLGRLVQREHSQGDPPHAAIGSPVHFRYTSLVPARRSCNARLSGRAAMSK